MIYSSGLSPTVHFSISLPRTPNIIFKEVFSSMRMALFHIKGLSTYLSLRELEDRFNRHLYLIVE